MKHNSQDTRMAMMIWAQNKTRQIISNRDGPHIFMKLKWKNFHLYWIHFMEHFYPPPLHISLFSLKKKKKGKTPKPNDWQCTAHVGSCVCQSRNESCLFQKWKPSFPFALLFSQLQLWLCPQPQPYESLEENAKCVMSSFFQSTRSHSAYCRLQQVINDKEFDLYRWKRSVFNWIQSKEEIRSQGSLETHVNCPAWKTYKRNAFHL